METIETQIWEPNPENLPYLRLARCRTVEEVYQDIKNRLKQIPCPGEDCSLLDSMDYFSISLRNQATGEIERDKSWPERYRWISCFAVTGSNEGYYIHVEVITPDDKGPEKRTLLYLGKTFVSMDTALIISNELTKMLGA